MTTSFTKTQKAWAGAALLATASVIGLWPQPAVVVSFATHDAQHVLTAELDGQVVADRTVADAWEQWQIEPQGDGVALKSAHGRYLAAELDGRVVADREAVGPWEVWRVVSTDGGVGLRSAHGCFLVAEEGGGGAVRANRCYDAPGPWETLTPSASLDGEVARALPPIVGRLRLERDAFRDDTGFVLPTYAHAGDLFSVFVRDEPRALRELDAVAAAGYHGLRVWVTLGCGPSTASGCRPGDYWYRREVGPDVTPDYWPKLAAFRDALRARSLRLVASQGDLTQIRDRRAYVQRLAAIDSEAPFIDVIDGGNEMWQNGEPDISKLAQFVRWYADAGGKALKTLTDAPLYGPGAPEPAEQLNRFSIPPADLFDVHSFRGGHSWDKRRHIWGYVYCGHGCPEKRNGINSEPPGGGARVTAIENRDEMDDEAVALLALASHLGRQAHVWFSGEGVILDRGLAGEPGFAAVPRAVALLPHDVQTFEIQTHSEPTPAGRARVLESEAARGLRIDGRIAADGRLAFTLDGPPGSYAPRVARAFTGMLCHPGTGACVDVSRRAGEQLPVSFTRGRLLVGRLQ